ncbi:MAG: ankyrin repeat domain-containing protein, partial [Thermoanaerobaculia bacterium]
EGAAGSPLPIAAGASLLQWAAYYGDVSAARTLLRHGAALSELGADLGLNAAAFHGHWQLCEFLIEHGGDPTYADPATGETALHSALTHDDRMRYDLVVRVLLAAGADVHAPTKAGIETGSFMRDCRTRGESPLHRAAAFGGVETIQRLLDAGAVVTSRDAHGDSPLSWASWYRRPAEILRLLTFGPFRLHPEVLPLRANLLGKPSANT